MSDFLTFAQAYGLHIDHLVEGRWVRVKTVDKTRKRNGAYKFLGDVGFVQNHATMEKVAVWHPDGKIERIDRAAMRKVIAQNKEQQRRRQQHAAEEAARILKASELIKPSPAVAGRAWRPAKEAVLAHPYLIRKSLHDVPALVHEGFLIVPMRVDVGTHHQLVNVQRISADGEKRFLPGGRAKDAFHRLGPWRPRETWLVEGYATGLSLWRALKALYRQAAVIVCFSAGNLRHPDATHVMADNDESGAGERAAAATGLPWVMPTEIGMDANDLMVRDGLQALVHLIRGARMT